MQVRGFTTFSIYSFAGPAWTRGGAQRTWWACGSPRRHDGGHGRQREGSSAWPPARALQDEGEGAAGATAAW